MKQKKLFSIIVVFGLLMSGGFSAVSGEGPWKFEGCCFIQGYKECWGPKYFPDQASCQQLVANGVAQCRAGAAEYGARYSITGGCTYDENYDRTKCINSCASFYVCSWENHQCIKRIRTTTSTQPQPPSTTLFKTTTTQPRTTTTQSQQQDDAKQKCLNSCATFYICSWENSRCIKRIASQEEQEQQIAQAQQIIGSAIDDWVGQAVQLPAGKISDEDGNSVSADTLKQQGIGESLPKINVEYNIKNRKSGDDVSATLPEGATVTRITTTLKQPTDDATMDVSVIYGKDWQNYRGANRAPDYPSKNGEQVDKMLVVNTKNNDQPYEDYSQALIEFSTTRHSYAYSESESKVTAEQLKSQQDLFKYLETKSDAAKYKPQGYSWDSFTKLLLGKQASDAANAKGVAVAIYNEDKKSWEKLPSWKISCDSNICRYAALAPHLSTFAIVEVPNGPNTNTMIFGGLVFVVATIVFGVSIFLTTVIGTYYLLPPKKRINKVKIIILGIALVTLTVLTIIICTMVGFGVLAANIIHS
ncbi:MAG: hypothetical protein V1744_00980 [Candidatus Altiarchaeota archaeon]